MLRYLSLLPFSFIFLFSTAAQANQTVQLLYQNPKNVPRLSNARCFAHKLLDRETGKQRFTGIKSASGCRDYARFQTRLADCTSAGPFSNPGTRPFIPGQSTCPIELAQTRWWDSPQFGASALRDGGWYFKNSDVDASGARVYKLISNAQTNLPRTAGVGPCDHYEVALSFFTYADQIKSFTLGELSSLKLSFDARVEAQTDSECARSLPTRKQLHRNLSKIIFQYEFLDDRGRAIQQNSIAIAFYDHHYIFNRPNDVQYSRCINIGIRRACLLTIHARNMPGILRQDGFMRYEVDLYRSILKYAKPGRNQLLLPPSDGSAEWHQGRIKALLLIMSTAGSRQSMELKNVRFAGTTR